MRNRRRHVNRKIKLSSNRRQGKEGRRMDGDEQRRPRVGWQLLRRRSRREERDDIQEWLEQEQRTYPDQEVYPRRSDYDYSWSANSSCRPELVYRVDYRVQLEYSRAVELEPRRLTEAEARRVAEKELSRAAKYLELKRAAEQLQRNRLSLLELKRAKQPELRPLFPEHRHSRNIQQLEKLRAQLPEVSTEQVRHFREYSHQLEEKLQYTEEKLSQSTDDGSLLFETKPEVYRYIQAEPYAEQTEDIFEFEIERQSENDYCYMDQKTQSYEHWVQVQPEIWQQEQKMKQATQRSAELTYQELQARNHQLELWRAQQLKQRQARELELKQARQLELWQAQQIAEKGLKQFQMLEVRQRQLMERQAQLLELRQINQIDLRQAQLLELRNRQQHELQAQMLEVRQRYEAERHAQLLELRYRQQLEQRNIQLEMRRQSERQMAEAFWSQHRDQTALDPVQDLEASLSRLAIEQQKKLDYHSSNRFRMIQFINRDDNKNVVCDTLFYGLPDLADCLREVLTNVKKSSKIHTD